MTISYRAPRAGKEESTLRFRTQCHADRHAPVSLSTPIEDALVSKQECAISAERESATPNRKAVTLIMVAIAAIYIAYNLIIFVHLRCFFQAKHNRNAGQK